MAGEGALEQFLNALVPVPERLRWVSRVDVYWRQRFKSKWNKVRPGSFQEPFQIDPAIPGLLEDALNSFATPENARDEAAQAQRRVERLRLKFEQDSAAVHDVVRMVSPLFGNNPRRLKQFLSTYRLALALTYSQGILASVPHEAGVTMQQLGKFVALLMKFPDLRGALAGLPGLLGDLEASALEWPKSAVPDNPNLRWLQSRPVRDLLAYRVPVSPTVASLYGDTADFQFSLLRLDVSRLMSLLPKAQPEPETADKPATASVVERQPEGMEDVTSEAPPGPAANVDLSARQTASRVGDSDQTYLQLFQGLAENYQRLRQTMSASNERTSAMTAIVQQVRSEARALGADGSELALSALLGQNTDGTRIVALGLACARIQQRNLEWLIGFLREFRSPFEHFWTIRALDLHKRFFDPGYASNVAEVLHGLMPEIQKDPGRLQEAESLQAQALEIAVGQRPSSASESQPMA